MKFIFADATYWAQILIAFSQVTFGVAWAILFLPFDVYKMLMLVLNIVATLILVVIGAIIKGRKG